MNDKQKPNLSDAKDGFDLIDYPCDYLFKAMCKSSQDAEAKEIMRNIVLEFVEPESLLEVRGNASRTGKFESVTLSVRLQNREQLEAIYQAIANSPCVVMTL